MSTEKLIVIGGGPAGYVSAIRAAQLGMNVILVEKDKPGGTCLNRGCMPTKALLHSAEIYREVSDSARFGISADRISVNWEAVQQNRKATVKKLTDGVRSLMKANRINYIQGNARFTGPKTVEVGGQTMCADKVIIACGCSPKIPSIPGIKTCPAVIDSTSCLELGSIPESIMVIGGGVTGCELGSVYNSFGSKVTIIETEDCILPQMDTDVSKEIRRQLVNSGIEILTGCRVEEILTIGERGKLRISTPEGERETEAEKILISVGRTPECSDLCLESAGVKTENGFISVNENLESSAEGVYAAGDCTGKIMLAHAAMRMGEIAAENAAGGHCVFKPAECPVCAYIGPESASIGYSEKDLKREGIEYNTGRFAVSANGKAVVSGHTDGFVKVLSGKRYGEILGVHIVAPNATDIISEAVLAVNLEATVDELASVIHCHPTVSEAFREAVLAVDSKAIHIPNR